MRIEEYYILESTKLKSFDMNWFVKLASLLCLVSVLECLKEATCRSGPADPPPDSCCGAARH